ncbi:MAG: hypothetical protein HN509_02965 [Halobacteriovoraceae bacterium]|jgi:hypothetical protein|nr:hypothetical protein [Halobacteriovoraceae bacterium]MBT5093917.1 hypothetical protein [Halobacteriovoraceae bacterium]
MEGIKFFLKRPSLILPQIKYKIFIAMNPDVPWITPPAIKFLDSILTKDFNILEYGSGRSTSWLARRCQKLVSIEGYGPWKEIVDKKLQKFGITNVDYRFIDASEEHSGGPDQAEMLREGNIPAYAAVINEFPDQHFDLVTVDGSYRMICVKVALDKIKSKGHLMIDNSNWMKIEDWGVPADWTIVHRSNIKVGETTLWQKP